MTSEQQLEALIGNLVESRAGDLSPLGAGILSAAHLGFSQDTRSFASKLGLAHALVIRECVDLAEEAGVIALEDRGDRSQRLFFSLTDAGQALFEKVAA